MTLCEDYANWLRKLKGEQQQLQLRGSVARSSLWHFVTESVCVQSNEKKARKLEGRESKILGRSPQMHFRMHFWMHFFEALASGKIRDPADAFSDAFPGPPKYAFYTENASAGSRIFPDARASKKCIQKCIQKCIRKCICGFLPRILLSRPSSFSRLFLIFCESIPSYPEHFKGNLRQFLEVLETKRSWTFKIELISLKDLVGLVPPP